MRKPADSGHLASRRRLVLVSLCTLSLGGAFFACLNPRPEDYPSETDSPRDRAFAPGDGTRQGPGLEVTGETTSAPEEPAPEAAPQPLPPSSIAPAEVDAGADAGADAGVSDAGVSDAGVVSSSAD